MEKVILIQEQAAAIEKLLSLGTIASKKRLIKYNINGVESIDKDIYAKTISEMDFDTLICALYIGYEVEKNFEVGDWVVVDGYSENYNGKVLELTKIYKGAFDLRYCKFSPSLDRSHKFCLDDADIRHATESEIEQEKERRRWTEMDREVNQFKEMDIINIRGKSILYREVNYVNQFSEVGVVEDDFMYKPEKCELVCRVEDRKDVKE